jgi:hypothetical protein
VLQNGFPPYVSPSVAVFQWTPFWMKRFKEATEVWNEDTSNNLPEFSVVLTEIIPLPFHCRRVEHADTILGSLYECE